MGFSPLANMSRRIQPGGRQSRRNSRIMGFTVHHQAGVNAHGEASNPRREVSAQYWITNEGVIIPNIDENMRAWTTGMAGYPAGAASDHRNITVEVSNSPAGVRNGTWAISAAAQRSLTALIADIFRRHGLGRVRRGTSSGVAVHRDFVPTSCPGPYIMGRIGSIISDAERLRSGGGTAPTKGLTVKHYARADKFARSGGRVLKPREHLYLHTSSKVKSQASNIVGGVGPYSITLHIYAKGTPGEALDVSLMWQDSKTKRNSRHYIERMVFDQSGTINGNVEFKRAVGRGYRVFARAQAPSSNRSDLTIGLFDSDAYLFQ